MTRRLRFLTAVLATLGMLFAQLAVAAYACPAMGTGLEASSPSSMEDCCDPAPMDIDQPALCHAHCHPGAQALEKPTASLPHQAPASTLVAVPVGPRLAATVVAPGEQHSLLVRATAPPVALRHCCLRV